MTPCPFCAGTKFHYNTKAKSYFAKKQAERERRDTSNHLVRCTKCGAKGPLRSTEAEAISAWNARPPATNTLPELLDALEAITQVRVQGHDNIWAGASRCREIAVAAIAKARGEVA